MSIQDKLNNDKILIIERVNNNESMKSIAKDYNCNHSTIGYYLKSINVIPANSRSKNYGKIIKDKDKIILMFTNGMTANQISKKLNYSIGSICRNLRKWGFDTQLKNNCKFDKNNLLKNKKEEVIKLFKNHSCNNIGKILGYSEASVIQLLNKNGYNTSNWKISVDETFFKEINTEEKAYILGWMYSDGNVTDKGLWRISIDKKDAEILEKIKKIVKYEGQLSFSKNTNMISLNINRKSMVDDLISLGCMPAKSMILKCPTNHIVSEQLFHHFLRGYFDGDGSIYVKNGKLKYINIVGSYNFIYGLSSRLEFAHKIYQRYKNREPKDSSHQLFISKKEQMRSFIEYLYKNATIYLDRKYKIAQEIMTL